MRVKKNQYLFTAFLLLFNSLLMADTGIAVFTAYTYINDLGLSLQDTANNNAVSRSGIKLGVNADWADINYQGGNSITLFANQDTDLSDNRNIRDIGFSVLHLQPLSKQWLLRSRLGIEQYRNDVLQSTAFDGFVLSATAGYMAAENSGVDIQFKKSYEKHRQDINDKYNTGRYLFSLKYYFPSLNAPQWNMQLQRQYNNADGVARDYTSNLLSVAYQHWQYKNIQGSIVLQRRDDTYDENNTQIRRDKLNFVALNILKPITKRWFFQTSLSAGYFDSNINNETQHYLQINIGVQTRI